MSTDKIIVPNLSEWQIEGNQVEFFPFMFGDNRLVGADLANNIATIPDEDMTSIAAKIQDMIDWIFDHQTKIAKNIIAKNYIQLAEKWVKQGEKFEGQDNSYLIRDIKETLTVKLPISEQDFSQAIQYSSIYFIFDKNNQMETCIIYVTFRPDYFCSHAIEVYLDDEYIIKIGGF
ncbi:DUF2262 domain-containing protein [Listeria welshimeri]|nr:DUF2262 domain-containing protein [Listeria welshimeri]MBC1973611.1 DUF2262 domain-containing protein [Listeria welshimeri]MBC1993906.1 DUF2262 domain-containing protein [Listeria welshimeri]MBC2028542.1 DUF2262 domain-containing protein [Listeria welshimeri]MBC2347321.1 DUF2262 domain-containing protein [Listeria welshimeri]